MQKPAPDPQPASIPLPASTARVGGLVLAAGAGSRYGMPKALVHDAAGRSWLQNAVDVLVAAGCSPVIVVLGASGAHAAALLNAGDNDPASTNGASAPSPAAHSARQHSAARPTASVLVVHATDWAEGLSASLRAGLRCALEQPDLVAVAVIPVDVPDLNTATVARLMGLSDAGTLRQARFAGRPGHPVVIGRAHWVPLLDTLAGDTGARPYLREHDVEAVECGDLGTGADVDRPD
ncbi:NTP transferase domain-containing protein [Cryobacterium sp. Y82]|uniref:nucleotidyltransferase family protein n=1 Tax=Cryobacterium sp. Y82 TaxID=2045017 RepID=UPI000CE3DEE6|nr:nucleotidyltransferase family protein [Cryobacterium sp. Y82]